MEPRLIALKLFVDQFGVPFKITTVNDRKLLQKLVYLGQCAGADLGYRFGWYLKGPYSTSLTRDYYSLADAISLGDRSADDLRLRSYSDLLAPLRQLLTVPDEVPLSREDWMELIASIHYLRTITKYDSTRALEVLGTEKPNLAPYVNQAEQALRKVQLLN